MSETNPRQLQCESCGEVFLRAWSDADAQKEAQQDPYGIQNGEMSIICDDCFQEMIAWADAHGGIDAAVACAESGQECRHCD